MKAFIIKPLVVLAYVALAVLFWPAVLVAIAVTVALNANARPSS